MFIGIGLGLIPQAMSGSSVDALLGGNPLDLYGQAAFLFDVPRSNYRNGTSQVGDFSSLTGLTFTRASTGYAQTAAGVLIPFASGAPRITDKGLLIEGARTNLCLQSGFAGGGSVPTSWTQPSGAVGTSTPGVSSINPDVVAYTQSATAQRPYFQQAVTFASNTTYTVSVYIEEVTGTLALTDIMTAISLPTGCTGVGDSLGNLAAGQRRTIVYSGTYTGAAVGFRVGLGASANATGTVRFSMPQVEAGAFPSSYIPTTTTSVTRPADVCSIAVSGLAYPVTMFAEFERVVDTGGNEAFIQVNAGGNDQSSISVNGSTDKMRTTVSAGGVTQADISSSASVALNTVTKGALRVATNDINQALNGTLGTQDTSATAPATPTTIILGSNATPTPCFGYLRRAAIWSTAFSDANLQGVTG